MDHTSRYTKHGTQTQTWLYTTMNQLVVVEKLLTRLNLDTNPNPLPGPISWKILIMMLAFTTCISVSLSNHVCFSLIASVREQHVVDTTVTTNIFLCVSLGTNRKKNQNGNMKQQYINCQGILCYNFWPDISQKVHNV